MVAQWQSSTYSHGYLILPASLYIIWKRRASLSALNPTPSALAIALLIPATFGWLLGELTTTAVVEQFSVVVLIIGLVWGVLGSAVFRGLLFPLIFLTFAVPLGESLIPGLQDFSARFAVKLLSLSGIPVLLEGRYITVPHGRWEVAEVCSGVRYLMASLAVGFLFAGLIYRNWVRRIGFFLASAIVPILANGVRIFGIVLIGYLGGDRLALHVDHVLAGLVFFSLIMLLLFAIGLRWREDQSRRAPAVEVKRGAVPISAETKAAGENSFFNPRASLVLAGTLLVIGLGPLSAKYLWSNQPRAEEVQLSRPAVSAPWTVSERENLMWEARFQSPTAELKQTYESADQRVMLYMAYYSGGQAGGKLISSVNQLYDRQNWTRTGESWKTAEINGQPVRMHEVMVQSMNSSLVIWKCYWVDGTFTSDDYRAKLLQAKAGLFRSNQGAIAIVLASENGLPQARGPETLRSFLKHAEWQGDAQLARKDSH